MDLKTLEKENERLREENNNLKKILAVAKGWMKKEFKESVVKIAKGKLIKTTQKSKSDFFNENVEEIVTQKISSFFGEILILNTPSAVIDNIISAEINYYNLRENPISDGLSVISSYHKSLDILIEHYITKGFRKYAQKKGQTILRTNDVLEKALHSVVTKGYILSIGRLYHLIKIIKNDEELFDYGKVFKDYLKKYYYLNEMLLNDNFFQSFTKLIESEILGRKRHAGKISFAETRDARKLLIGDFKDKNSLIYKFIETQDLNF